MSLQDPATTHCPQGHPLQPLKPGKRRRCDKCRYQQGKTVGRKVSGTLAANRKHKAPTRAYIQVPLTPEQSVRAEELGGAAWIAGLVAAALERGDG